MAFSCPDAAILILLSSLLSVILLKGNAQITTGCTSSVISTFTPCLNFVTGSTGTGSSPTEDCCNSLQSLMANNVDCACLIVTGNVPVSIPFINSSIAVMLPRACQSSVPLQCKATGVPLPPPGPVLFGPTQAPSATPSPPTTRAHRRSPPPASAPALAPQAHHAHTPKVSKAVAAPPELDSLDTTAPAPAPAPESSSPRLVLGPSANPGIRPVFNPDSSSAPSLIPFPLPSYLQQIFLCFGITVALNLLL